MIKSLIATRRFLADDPADRGDVPGWVMVTLMTASLVVMLWGVVGKQLGELFTSALAILKPISG